MNFLSKFITQKIKNGIICGFVSGFLIGCFPNKILIYINKKKYKTIANPLMTGIIGSMGIIFSPFLIINYMWDGVYFDKLIDKYDIDINRYHQYDDKNNKHAFPSVFVIDIKFEDN